MKIFFWDFQDTNDIIRQWLMFSINVLVLLFTSLALYRTWAHYRRCMFEMMPLSINLGATLILLFLKLFQKGYEFDYIGHLIEVFTYFLFCYTFAIMYSLITNTQQRRKVRIIWNVLLGVMIALLVVLSIMVFTGLISKKCKQKQQVPSIYALVIEFLSFAPTMWFGVKILVKMNDMEKGESKDNQQISAFASQIFIKERRKQITLVLITYFVSLLFRLITTLLTIYLWKSLFHCDKIEQAYIITSQKISGQLILILGQVNQLLPHVVIPIAMYVIPLRKMRRAKSVILEGLLDDDDEHYNRDDHIQSKVATLLTSSSNSSSSSYIAYIGQRKNSQIQNLSEKSNP